MVSLFPSWKAIPVATVPGGDDLANALRSDSLAFTTYRHSKGERLRPEYAIPKTTPKQRNHEQRQRGGRTPMKAQTWQKGGCLSAPLGTVAGDWENQKAYTQAP
ncbi:hypothetical protein N7447_004663 [Penicillium robsamsonii]|uniref:uncharacterized protein n=1 Tax=Penicillium robsamsonii TaxID=1792511 RepID=UPI00254857DD|nr:uncharacterized protein N7447_004663 [Penicillium robsamsonii]KAJ5827900.1 hypothetical protein N7447_004663 [Penicillium robsamsonii]